MNPVFLKRVLLLFWAVWLTVVFTTNTMDGLKALNLLPEAWAFASGNYCFLCETTARYDTPSWVNGLLFLGVINWEGVAAVLFWLAWARFRRKHGQSPRTVYAAFTAGLTLWAAFLIAYAV